MHCTALLSLAFVFGAVAGPCMPGTSVTADSSTSIEASETSSPSATSSADSSSLSQSTSLSTLPSTSSTTDSTVSSTTFDSATGSTTVSTSSTTLAVTSSATSDATTSSATATSSPALGNFNAIAQGGWADGTPARLQPPAYGDITLGTYNPGNAPVGVLSIEEGTGSLLVDRSKICGFYSPYQESASLYTCNASPRSNEAPVTCTLGQADGGHLKCSAPAMICIEDFDDENDPVCYTTGSVWTYFTAFQFLGNYFLLNIGSLAAQSQRSYVPIDLIIQAV
ncbi:hypothetical protein CEP54_015548 [Fusarium duplospermum]|uniref:Uncharacterized protein n=1 Tax=Fusarium duplospermum TaxID=1325734 RepID=A0A428NN56_9HYPO|nr:hypothetical protein CEP54_015548 [Fusarium duplospermum]